MFLGYFCVELKVCVCVCGILFVASLWSILLPFELSQTMEFTQQHKLIGLALYSTLTTVVTH